MLWFCLGGVVGAVLFGQLVRRDELPAPRLESEQRMAEVTARQPTLVAQPPAPPHTASSPPVDEPEGDVVSTREQPTVFVTWEEAQAWSRLPTPSSWTRVVAVVCEACTGAAQGLTPSSEEVTGWLRSRDLEMVRRGIGSALVVKPPCIDDLLAIARDDSMGVHAAAALVIASSDAQARDRIVGDLDALLQSRDPVIQYAAMSVLHRFGEPGHALALAAVRQGNLSAEAFSLVLEAADDPGRVSLAEAALEARAVAPELVHQVLAQGRVLLRQSARLTDLVEDFARAHPDPWLRSAARETLARVESEAGEPLLIRTAFYGARGKFVDVTTALRDRVEDGKLRTSASNELAGDPAFGIGKELVVEYQVGSLRFVRAVHEGGSVHLP